jgi:membrane-bound serine protease (ClpP class)
MVILIFLYLLGIALLCAEIYLPGAILGIIGAISLVLTVVVSFSRYGSSGGFIALFVVSLTLALAMYFFVKFFPGTWLGKKLLLSRNLNQPESGETKTESLLGKKGVALTDLRPSGMARIGADKVDVVTQGDYISKGKEVEVIGQEGNRIVVK